MTQRLTPYLAFAFLLLLLITGSLIIQTVGHALDIQLSGNCIYIALIPALWLTYYFFPLPRNQLFIVLALAIILALLGIISAHMLDFSADGMGYQQPSAQAILNGWNPFKGEAVMMWQNIYPSGVWAVEASLGALYRSIEDTKMLQVWWLFITLPILLHGLSVYKKGLNAPQAILAVLCVLSPVVLTQLLTHYVDAMIYMSGITFLGGLLMYGETQREKMLSIIIMTACVLFIISTKLSGIYHAAMLCSATVLFLWLKHKQFPWRVASLLFIAGVVATCVVGYHPYVTSFIKYGPSLFPDDTEVFSGAQRPSTFDAMHGFERFFTSVFSITGGIPHEPIELKWPWQIMPYELEAAGWTDPRTGGFGPLFAVGFLSSLAIITWAAIRKQPVDKGLVLIATVCLLFSAAFPQSWWARYVPFAYAVPFLLLLALPTTQTAQKVLCCTLIIWSAASTIAAAEAYALYRDNETRFAEVLTTLHTLPSGSVYLVPPVPNYAKYNGAYMPLKNRLRTAGIDAPVKIGIPCKHRVEEYSEFKICY